MNDLLSINNILSTARMKPKWSKTCRLLNIQVSYDEIKF